MSSYRHLVYPLLFLLCGGVEAAAQPPSLSLARAVEIALRQSPRLAGAEARVGAAAAGLSEAKARRWPSVELSEEVLRTDNPTLVFSNKLGQERFMAADFALDALNRPDPLTNYRSRMAVAAPLYTFGRLRHGSAVAKLLLESAELGQESVAQAVAHDAAAAFVAVVTAERQLDAARVAADTVAGHLRLTRDLFDAGLVVESDVLQVEVRQSEVEEMVVRAEGAVAVGRADLNRVMGMDQATQWRLEPPEADDPEGAPDDLDALIGEARSSNPELAAVRVVVEAARQRLAATRAELRPELVGGGFVEANGADLASADGDNWGVQVGLRWTLFDGFATRARSARAEEELRAAEAALAEAEAGVELRLRRAVHDLAVAGRRRQLAGRGVDLAVRALAIVEDRYREGLATAVELADAEAAASAARARRVAAEGDLIRADSALDLAMGRL